MDRPNPDQIREEALSYLAGFDAEGSPYHGRSAEEIADFLLESKFAQIEEECDWPEEFCHEYFDIAKAALLAAGVSP
jgi:hypothetical protein